MGNNCTYDTGTYDFGKMTTSVWALVIILLVGCSIALIWILNCLLRHLNSRKVRVHQLRHKVEIVAEEATEEGGIVYLEAPGLFIGENLSFRYIDYSFENSSEYPKQVMIFHTWYDKYLFEIPPHGSSSISQVLVSVQCPVPEPHPLVIFKYDTDSLEVSQQVEESFGKPGDCPCVLVRKSIGFSLYQENLKDVKISGIVYNGLFLPTATLPGGKFVRIKQWRRRTYLDAKVRQPFCQRYQLEGFYLLKPGKSLPKFRYK